MADPASLRYNNPGAIYPGPSSKAYGSIATHTIGGGHKIAEFPDFESGAAAQFDLMRNKYAGMPIEAAIHKWSGGNNSSGYVDRVRKETGIEPGTLLSHDMLSDPHTAVPIARAMAGVEAGVQHPEGEDAWHAAHARAYGGDPSQVPIGTTGAPPRGAFADMPEEANGAFKDASANAKTENSFLERTGSALFDNGKNGDQSSPFDSFSKATNDAMKPKTPKASGGPARNLAADANDAFWKKQQQYYPQGAF